MMQGAVTDKRQHPRLGRRTLDFESDVHDVFDNDDKNDHDDAFDNDYDFDMH
jgi:hypothetical protein